MNRKTVIIKINLLFFLYFKTYNGINYQLLLLNKIRIECTLLAG